MLQVFITTYLDPSQVTSAVINQVIDLVQDFQHQKPNKKSDHLAPQLAHLLESPEKEDNWDHFECKYCKDRITGTHRVFAGQRIWKQHLASRSHKKNEQFSKRETPKKGDKEGWLRLQSSS
jgi:hypothetical protein